MPLRFDEPSIVDVAALALATFGGLLIGAARLLTRTKERP